MCQSPARHWLRRKSSALARLEDLNLRRWRILIHDPKGRRFVAAEDHAPILPQARPAVLDFLAERDAKLGRLGEGHEALVIFASTGTATSATTATQ